MEKYFVEINNNEYEVLVRTEEEVNNGDSGMRANPSIKQDKNIGSNKIENNNSKADKSDNAEIELDDNAGEVPVESPMTGSILSIGISEGDKVNKDEVLMTIEAMKMETEIVAPAAGTVSKIIAREGNKCKQGEKLALIKEAGGN